jgi:hypothetical protein
MNKFRFTLMALAIMAFTLMISSSAQAQATRTWVSGVGDDLNPCSRTAPCKTFAGAISKTAANGEIDCIDSGGFGTVTITKSITIDGAAVLAGVLAAGTNGVNVNDSATATPNTIVVTLRNLSINGATSGLNGVRFVAGKSLNIDSCQIFGFKSGTGFGLDVALTVSLSEVHVKDTNFHNCTTGVRLTTTSGVVVTTFDNITIDKMTADGMQLQAGGFADVRDSVISFPAGVGINITGGANSGVNLVNTTIAHATTGVAVGGSTSRMTGSAILQNGTGISIAGGAMRTGCNNFIDGNTTPISGGGLTSACVQ